MTFRERQQAMLDDLLRERAECIETTTERWVATLEKKIADMKAAMEGV